MARWDEFDLYFPPSRPLAVKGGIRAQSKRGGFGESWWARRWIAVLESFQIGARLARGRRYARSGQVLSIDIAKGRILAAVQGSRPSPYQVTIHVKPLGAAAWRAVAASAAEQAVFASKLLGGEMPREIEQAFGAAHVTLFPERYNDLKTACSCPDASNPCKHIAAVYYLLGEEFDRDPFLIFRMRGLDRDEFLSLLGETQARAAPEPPAPAPGPEPLIASPEQFYGMGALPEDLIGKAPAGLAGAAIAKRLGRFPFWRGSTPLAEFLESAYTGAAHYAAETLERNGRG